MSATNETDIKALRRSAVLLGGVVFAMLSGNWGLGALAFGSSSERIGSASVRRRIRFCETEKKGPRSTRATITLCSSRWPRSAERKIIPERNLEAF